MPEQQNIEYKQSWRDEFLKWICGFANAQGGKIFIGIDDKGNVTGVDDYEKLMDDIPNKVVNHLGLIVDVNLHHKSGKPYIEIDVPVSSVPVSYHGAYHYRSGSTKQELKGAPLHNFLLSKIGLSWERQPVPGATLDDIDEAAIKSFVQKASAQQRISTNAVNTDIRTFLKNLDLINENGELLIAALLLFGKRPKKYAPAAYFKIGRFGKSHSDLKFQDVVEGNILDMADRVMEILSTKYLIRPISYKGLQRLEGLEYPEAALREAILNAIIHKDYSGTTIFLSVYDDRLMIWNPGELPSSLTVDLLKEKHSSQPRNRLIADVFFMAGYIESWGRGIDIMMNGCREYGLPEPIIAEEQGGISVTFLKDIYTEEYLKSFNLNERQKRAVLYIKENGEITNAIYQSINQISKAVATKDLADLVSRKLIQKVGTTGKGTRYILPAKGL
ncbi:MAG: putative DNA binding domain-containing protein [Sediminibacterium magnilacihabitans]|jgi:ATP-dependent DNA helicase RecG|nr:putative DNA binding domain-containing protein [Sediminibacterium magnilacihabitans]PQV61617.1 ATP-dependent DNA helicase RecG [Sediminibacterium magnilacihabitans]